MDGREDDQGRLACLERLRGAVLGAEKRRRLREVVRGRVSLLRRPEVIMNWIDGLSGAGEFLIGVAAVVAGRSAGLPLEGKLGGWLATVFAIAPIALRRAVFGAPRVSPPREGAWWSLVSIASLLATLFGLPMILVGGLMLKGTFHHFRSHVDEGAEAEVARGIVSERVKSLEVLGVGMALVGLGSVGHWARRRPVTS